MQPIPLLDLHAQMAGLRPEFEEAFKKILDRGDFILGKAVKEFETAFAAFLKAKHVVACANGTDALTLALKAAGIKPGDKVITTSLTFPATVESILHAGGIPVLLDVNPDTELLDTQLVQKYLQSQKKSDPPVRAVVPVHLRGNPCDMASLLTLAKEHRFIVIEDAAQAHGAKFNGQNIGTFGIASAFSFYPGKNLGALGDAGAIATSDPDLAVTLTRLCNHGRLSKFDHELIGFNSRMDTLHAACLTIKLRHLEKWNTGRQKVAAKYDALLKTTKGVRLPQTTKGGEHIYHHYAIRVSQRDPLQKILNQQGIATGVHYPDPTHLIPVFQARIEVPWPLPHTEEISKTTLSLPIFPELTDESIHRIVQVIAD